MKRSDFFKSIFGVAAVVALPNQLQATESEFSFDEIFEVHEGNERLVYPKKDSKIYRSIKELIGADRILDKKYFTCYLGFHSNVIPIKESYSIADFMPFVLALNSYYKKNDSFSETDKGVFFRMIKETPKTMYFDTFLGDVRGQYHS